MTPLHNFAGALTRAARDDNETRWRRCVGVFEQARRSVAALPGAGQPLLLQNAAISVDGAANDYLVIEGDL